MNDTGIRFQFRGEEMHLYKGTYAEPRSAPALQLMFMEDFGSHGKALQPYMTASVNLGSTNSNEVAIKNYSENEGILDVLIENKVVSEPIRRERSGFVEIPVCRLLI